VEVAVEVVAHLQEAKVVEELVVLERVEMHLLIILQHHL
jgi:hypothetical protein